MKIKELKDFKKEVEKRDDEDAIFGIYYKKVGKNYELAVNGGDWMNEEIADFIDDWCKDKVKVEYVAEVSNEQLISEGYIRL